MHISSRRLWLCRGHDAAPLRVLPALHLRYLLPATPAVPQARLVLPVFSLAASHTVTPPGGNPFSAFAMAFSTAMLPHVNSVTNFCPALRRPRSPLRIPGMTKCRILCVDIAATAASDTCDSPSSKETQITVSITGATGFIGRRLVKKLSEGNHEVRVLTRSKAKARIIFPVEDFPRITIAEEPEWKRCIEGSYAVVNLAGTPISTRWSYEAKKEIKESRTRVTSTVVELINSANSNLRPSVLVSATAIGYYGTSETKVFDEKSPSGNDFLSEVCREWEARALEVDKDVRLTLIRIGLVLGKEGGALAKMIPFFMMFAGGPLGTGNQWFSWIHMDDLVNLILEALTNPSYRGIINGTAPNPVRLSEMCEDLGKVLGRPSWLPVPDFALKAILGEGATLVLEGQKVLPSKARELGFSYKYPYIKDALQAVLSS